MSPREFLIGVCFNITLEFPNHCCGTPLSKDNALWDAFPKALSKHTTCAKTHHTHTYTEVGACWNTAIHLLSHHLKLKVSNHIKKRGGCSVISDSLWPHGLYTVHGILQARVLEWVAICFFRGSSQPREWAQVSRPTGGFFTIWATRETVTY